MGQRKPQAEQTAVCFETPSDYEITVGGRKLVGSAQWRGRGGVLQHGTLPLHGDLTRILDYLPLSAEEQDFQASVLRQRVITLKEARGRPLPFTDAAQGLAHGFAQALNLTLVPGKLSAGEDALAAGIRRDRYAASEWTARRP